MDSDEESSHLGSPAFELLPTKSQKFFRYQVQQLLTSCRSRDILGLHAKAGVINPSGSKTVMIRCNRIFQHKVSVVYIAFLNKRSQIPLLQCRSPVSQIPSCYSGLDMWENFHSRLLREREVRKEKGTAVK